MNRTQRAEIKALRELEAGRRSFKKIFLHCVVTSEECEAQKDHLLHLKEQDKNAKNFRNQLRDLKKSCRNKAKVVMET